ncbi:glycosyltransferase family 39 protein, partial [bacterium]|nr:glycosyltransferase family 39 protein [bacterium]
DSEFFVRLPAILCFAVTLFFINRLCDYMFGAKVAFITSLLACLMPAFEFYSIFMMPDAPLLAFWSLGMYAGFRLYKEESKYWWIVLGLCCGLASTSKYPGFLVPLSTLLILVYKKKWSLFRGWQFPFSAILALAIFSPVIVWNSQNNWISFFFQAISRFKEANTFLDITGGSLLNITALPTPLGFIFFCWIAWQSLKKVEDERWLYLCLSFMPFALIIMVVACFRLIQLNWPLPIYPALIIATGAILEEREVWSKRKWQFILGVVFVPNLLFSLLPLISTAFPIASLNNVNEIAGWKKMGETADELIGSSIDPYHCFLAGHGYHIASQLAFYSKKPYLTTSSNIIDVACKSFDFWNKPGDYKGWNCIYVVAEDLKSDGTFRPREIFKREFLEEKFTSVVNLDKVTVYRGGRPLRRYRYFFCTNFQGMPEINDHINAKRM